MLMGSLSWMAREEGKSLWFLGTLMTLKASAESTNNAFSLIKRVAPASFALPQHIHHPDDEAFTLAASPLPLATAERLGAVGKRILEV